MNIRNLLGESQRRSGLQAITAAIQSGNRTLQSGVSASRRYHSILNAQAPEPGPLCRVERDKWQEVWDNIRELAADLWMQNQTNQQLSDMLKPLRETEKNMEKRVTQLAALMNYAEIGLPGGAALVAEQRVSKKKPGHAEYVQALLAMRDDGKLVLSNELDAVNLGHTLSRYVHTVCPSAVTSAFRHKDKLDASSLAQALRDNATVSHSMRRDAFEDDDDDDGEENGNSVVADA